MWRIILFCCRFRRATLVRILMLTDAFIWEDLPRTDPDTGYLSMTAWIPRIQKFTTLIIGAAVIVNGTKNLMLIFSSDDHSMVYHTWYPFDTAKSPTYELINITQVTGILFWRLRRAECSLYQTKTRTRKMFMPSESFIKWVPNHVFCLNAE